MVLVIVVVLVISVNPGLEPFFLAVGGLPNCLVILVLKKLLQENGKGVSPKPKKLLGFMTHFATNFA